jgi:sugar phosphate isomerase/epimerase
MMTLKNRLAGHTNSYHTYSLEAALEGIAAAGYRFVELTAVRGWTEHVPLGADGKTLCRIQRKLNELGLVTTSLSGHSDLTTKEGLDDGLLALDLCERMGISLMNTAIGGHSSHDENESEFLKHIDVLADAAADRDIMLGIEVHGDITSSGRKAIPLIGKIGRSNVRINYDTANVEFYDGGTKAVDDLPETVPYLVHFHAKDHIGGARVWNFPAPGEGQIDWRRVLEILKNGGYGGPISVEIEFFGELWPPLEEVNRSMKSAYQHLSSLGLQ